MRTAAAIILASLVAPESALAANIAAGRAIFNRCRICHMVDAGKKNGVGPNLHGIFGRKAGTSDDFAYSAAMRNSGIVWGDASLAKYLRDPRGFIPGNRMAFPGITDEQEIDNLLAFLHQATE